MITGGDDEKIGDTIEGIKTVDSIEVLGVKIDRKLQKLDDNWEKTLRKMVNLSNYWKLFRLYQWKSNDSKDILNFTSYLSNGGITNWR